MITWGDLKDWDAGALGDAGDQLRADLTRLERAGDALAERAVPGSWLGLASQVARTQQGLLVGTIERHLTGARAFANALSTAEGRVTAIQEAVVEIEHSARTQEFSISADGTVTDVSDPGEFASPRAADAHLERRTQARDFLVQRIEEVLTDATEVDSLLVQALPDDEFADDGPEGTVDPLVARTWSEMSEDERRGVLEAMAGDLNEQYGLDIDVVFDDLEDTDGDGVDDDGLDHRGFYRDSDRELHIDVNDLEDPDTINTVAHEIRHALQHEMVRDNDPSAWDDALIAAGLKDDPWNPPDGITRDDAEEWADNFDHYISAEDDFTGYESQPVEVDAREAGDAYLDDLTPEDLEQFREEAS